MSLLFDSLKNPGSDLGINLQSCISWNYDPVTEIDHVVIGKSSGPGNLILIFY